MVAMNAGLQYGMLNVRSEYWSVVGNAEFVAVNAGV